MHSVYLIIGDDDYLRQENIDRIKNKILTHFNKHKDLNFSTFFAFQNTASEVINSARSSSFFDKSNLILVRDYHNFSNHDKDLILKYCQNPNKKTVLILESSDRNLLKDNSIERLMNYCKLIRCNHPPLSKVSDYISRFAALRNKRISKEAVELLIMNLGNNLKNLNEAVEKISLYVNERDIKRRDVEALVGLDVDYKVYNLTDALGQKNKNQALKIIKQIAINKKASLKLLGGIIRYLERIYQARLLLSEGKSQRMIAESLSIYNFLADKFFKQVDNFSLKDIKRCFSYILDADLTLKTEKIKPAIILESLIIKMCAL